jgi:Domain of unknown function (DUF4157)
MGDAKGERQGLLTRPARPSSPLRDSIPGGVLRAVASGRSDLLDTRAVLQLQRAAGNAWVDRFVVTPAKAEVPAVRDVVGSGRGSPLEHSVRGRMERAFGQDFGRVRLHTGAGATASARSLNAHAYTVGEDIVFQGAAYNPHTNAGRRMLAHELTHVLQQRSGRVPGTPGADGITISDPTDAFEQEAERVAGRLVRSGGSPRVQAEA